MTRTAFNQRANEAAARLTSPSIEVEHYLLAMLHPDSDWPASRALRDCGLTYEAMVAEIAGSPRRHSEGRPPPSAGHGRPISIEADRLTAHAEGLALGSEHADLTPEHLLIAFIWYEERWRSPSILRRLGVTREQVRNQLGRHGVEVPKRPFPRTRNWSEWRSVNDAELDEIRQGDKPYLIGRRPDGATFACTEQV